MRRTFRYRLYPTKEQERKLEETLDECRWLYNHLLEQRRTEWEERQQTLSLYTQQAYVTTLKEHRVSLQEVNAQVLQNVAVRIDLAFKAFFRRVKRGESPGYPRFRGANRYESFCFPQAPSGCKLSADRLTLSKIGTVRVVLHRPILGSVKTCCVRRSSTGKWYAAFSCECDPAGLPETPERVGIDVGLSQFATFSTGESIDNPRFFRRDEKALATAQRKHSKTAKDSRARRKTRKAVSRIHERIRFRRHDFVHQNARRIVNRFQFIAVEDLSVNRMRHNHCLAKSISDAAWAGFASILSCKAEWAGRTFIAVNPAYTSQTCSACGHRQKMPLSQRTFACSCCLIVLGRDHNASLNILALGLQSAGFAPGSPGR
jgi:transposase, IS605 OrfB family, central region